MNGQNTILIHAHAAAESTFSYILCIIVLTLFLTCGAHIFR